MKIAVNTRFLLKNNLEGFGHFTNETLKVIVKNNPNIQFYFLFDRPFDKSFIYAKNITPVLLYPQARLTFLWHIWFNFSIAFWLKKNKPDLFISPDGYACLNTKIKQLVVIHDLAFEHNHGGIPKIQISYLKKYAPLFAKKASRIATVSEFSKSDIIKRYQIEESKIDVVYNGASQLFQPATSEVKTTIKEKYTQSNEYFLYVGSIHPRKNVANLLLAFDDFKTKTNSPFKLVLTGRMAWKTGSVLQAYENMNHKNEVVFTGYLSNEELAKITAAAFSLCYVSLFEGFGIPIVEAMKCAVPVICSNTSSMKEIAEGAALLINPLSTQSISEAMAKLYHHPELHLEMSKKGFEHQKKFSWENTANLLWKSCLKVIHK